MSPDAGAAAMVMRGEWVRRGMLACTRWGRCSGCCHNVTKVELAGARWYLVQLANSAAAVAAAERCVECGERRATLNTYRGWHGDRWCTACFLSCKPWEVPDLCGPGLRRGTP